MNLGRARQGREERVDWLTPSPHLDLSDREHLFPRSPHPTPSSPLTSPSPPAHLSTLSCTCQHSQRSSEPTRFASPPLPGSRRSLSSQPSARADRCVRLFPCRTETVADLLVQQQSKNSNGESRPLFHQLTWRERGDDESGASPTDLASLLLPSCCTWV